MSKRRSNREQQEVRQREIEDDIGREEKRPRKTKREREQGNRLIK